MSPAPPEPLEPVAIGGVGGSGTRVLAAMLQELGWFIGADLNPALDNGWFESLFWYRGLRVSGSRDEIVGRLRAFADASAAPGQPSPATRRTVRAAVPDFVRQGLTRPGRGRAEHARDSLSALARARRIGHGARYDRARYVGWGWKQPITHLYLDELAEAVPNLRYVHLVRNGLDMAFSRNQAQMRGFGEWYGLDPVGKGADERAAASLAFWARANRRAVETGRRRLGERFLLLRLEDLYTDPGPNVERFCRFIGVEPDEARHDRLTAIPVRPSTAGRSKSHSLDIHDPADLEALVEFGYERPA